MLPQHVQHSRAVDLGQVKVEDDQVVLALHRHHRSDIPIGCDIHPVVLGFQALAQKHRQRRVVFHHKYSHILFSANPIGGSADVLTRTDRLQALSVFTCESLYRIEKVSKWNWVRPRSSDECLPISSPGSSSSTTSPS